MRCSRSPPEVRVWRRPNHFPPRQSVRRAAPRASGGRSGGTGARAVELTRAGYRISDIVSGNSSASRRKGRALAELAHSRVVVAGDSLDGDLVWFCVPDREIAGTARQLSDAVDWRGKVALHSSGALASDELRVLRFRGAAVASVHPLMTFVRGSAPSLE